MIQLVRRVIGPDPKRCGIVFNKVNTKRASYRDVSEVISEGSPYPVLKSVISLREVYKTAIGFGATVFSVKGQATKPASQEITNVAMEMLGIMGISE